MVATAVLLAFATMASQLTPDDGRARLDLGASDLTFELPLHNGGLDTVHAHVTARVLDTDDRELAWGDLSLTVERGSNIACVPLVADWDELDRIDVDRLRWLRVHYHLETAADSVDVVLCPANLISAQPTLAVGTDNFIDSDRLPIWALVRDGGHQPIAGASVRFTLSGDDGPVAVAQATTASDGLALTVMRLPATADGYLDLKVSATGGLRGVSLESDLHVYRQAWALVHFDKALYQPGQRVNLRALVINDGRGLAAGLPVSLVVRDPESNVVARRELVTSEFGVAHASFILADDAQLGEYGVDFRSDGHEINYGRHLLVSRYELPSFAVDVESERGYHLPGERARVAVTARYHHGGPVRGGRVAIALASEPRRRLVRRVYGQDPASDIVELEPGAERVIGISDDQGRYVATVELGQREGDDWRYDDVTYVATVVDPDSGRSAERRFDLRLTSQPIHVYVRDASEPDPALPLQLWVSTSYADGTPASCRGTVDEVSFATNRHGVALVELPFRESPLTVKVRDDRGNEGSHIERYRWSSAGTVRLVTGRRLLAAGESIVATVHTGGVSEAVVVTVQAHGELIAAQVVHTRDHVGEVRFDYDQRMVGAVSVLANLVGNDQGESAATALIYPDPRLLQLDVAVASPDLRPGGEAAISFHAHGAGGEGTESAIGVVAVDRALIEHQRTVAEVAGHDVQVEPFSIVDDEPRIDGFNVRDLTLLDRSTPIDPDTDLLAGAVLQGQQRNYLEVAASDEPRSAKGAFAQLHAGRLDLLLQGLRRELTTAGGLPTGSARLDALMSSLGIPPAALRDAWDQPIERRVVVDRGGAAIELRSGGPDRSRGTDDDLLVDQFSWDYFERHAHALDSAIKGGYARTGRVAASSEDLVALLRASKLDFDPLVDPDGDDYRLQVKPTGLFIDVTAVSSRDEAILWLGRVDYFADVRDAIRRYVAQHEPEAFPASPGLWQQVSRALQLPTTLRDPWGRPLRVVTSPGRRDITSWDDLRSRTPRRRPGGCESLALRSDGEDGQPNSGDEFNVETFPGPCRPAPPRRGARSIDALSGRVCIAGTVVDQEGLPLPGASVTSSREDGSPPTTRSFTDARGWFALTGLRSGLYRVEFELSGFTALRVERVTVVDPGTTALDVILRISGGTEEVTVMAEAPVVNTTSHASTARIHDEVSSSQLGAVEGTMPLTTPRVRRYFPETLFWDPEIVTDGDGRASVRIPVADTITTWEVAAIASTRDGQIDVARTSFRSFQPFFVENELPPRLTVGDQIEVMAVARNYLDRATPIELRVTTDNALATSDDSLHLLVEPGATAVGRFKVTAAHIAKQSNLRVTAMATDTGDAVENSVEIQPYGRLVADSTGGLLLDALDLETSVSADAIAGTVDAALLIYPDPIGHATQGIAGMLQRPYGCGEQTVSSTRANVVVLRWLQLSGEQHPELEARARSFVAEGLHRLRRFHSSGGIAVWKGEAPSLEVTVAAVQLLNDARDFVPVDDDVEALVKWVVSNQSPDGLWPPSRWSPRLTEDFSLTTATIAAALAESSEPTVVAAVDRALAALAECVTTSTDPYMLASYLLAALARDQREQAGIVAKVIRGQAQSRGAERYWTQPSRTPYGGWGRAGAIETTAVVLRALAALDQSSIADPIIGGATLYLLRAKDQMGSWWSTAATLRAVEALLAVAPKQRPAATSTLEVVVAGQRRTVALAADSSGSPVRVDLSDAIASGASTVALRRPGGGSWIGAQLVSRHYVPWSADQILDPRLRLDVRYDRTEMTLDEVVDCQVKVASDRISPNAMLMVEVGLPPGVEVDRASLDQELGRFSHYEVRPDQVVVYLWSTGASQQFQFRFVPRLRMNAVTAPSSAWWFYNPDVKTDVPPTRFVVH